MSNKKNWIKDNWTDPVWSKVFAGIILTILGGIGTLLVSLAKKIPIADLYQKSVSSYIQINYFTIAIVVIILLALLIPAFLMDIVRIQLKDVINRKRGMMEILKERQIEALFPGKWLNEYEFKDGRKGKEVVEIKNGNEYHTLGRHLFTLDSVTIDEKNGIIKFNKNGVGDDHRQAFNTLRIINEKRYEGDEADGTKIVYTRIE
ncbi:hypothetical protein [Terrimonas alba]|uniref:hypothetical protein n=1 Tax=Terrimonas alba TaxID=3349636 RepID=UPI0035F3DC19